MVVTGIGLVSALGLLPHEVGAAVADGRSGIEPCDGLLTHLPIQGVARCEGDVRPLLRRRKDRKLIPRAAQLAIIAAHRALGEDRPDGIGLFMGVGREPADQDDVERALVRSCLDGRLDVQALSTVGLAAYPPLAPLRTLPNMVLAHVAIQLQLTGEGTTRCGEQAAGLAAIVEGLHAVREGRCDVALCGAGDSAVDPGGARDLARSGCIGPRRAPGEGAAMIRLERADRAAARGARAWARLMAGGTAYDGPTRDHVSPREGAWGRCGAATGVMDLVVDLASKAATQITVTERSGARAHLAWTW